MSASTGGVGVVCPVRDCGRELARGPRAWSCPGGHSFDVARSGYVNLLQPGDSRSRVPGDSPAAVSARARLEDRGFGQELRDAVESRVGALGQGTVRAALDAGAGTGILLGRLAARFGLEGWALDLSVPAARYGAGRRPELSWVVANVDRRLPFADGAFSLVLSCTGPRNPAEFRRILAPDGVLLVMVPAADDLIELRRAVQGQGRLVDRVASVLASFETWFECTGRTAVRTRRWLDRAELEDLCAATYRVRRSQRGHLAELEGLETTLSAEVLCFSPRGARDPAPGSSGGEVACDPPGWSVTGRRSAGAGSAPRRILVPPDRLPTRRSHDDDRLAPLLDARLPRR